MDYLKFLRSDSFILLTFTLGNKLDFDQILKK